MKKTPNVDIVKELAKLHRYLLKTIDGDSLDDYECGYYQAYREILAKLEAILERVR